MKLGSCVEEMLQRALDTWKSVAETLSLEIVRHTWKNANIQFWLKYSVQEKEEWEVRLARTFGKPSVD